MNRKISRCTTTTAIITTATTMARGTERDTLRRHERRRHIDSHLAECIEGARRAEVHLFCVRMRTTDTRRGRSGQPMASRRLQGSESVSAASNVAFAPLPGGLPVVVVAAAAAAGVRRALCRRSPGSIDPAGVRLSKVRCSGRESEFSATAILFRPECLLPPPRARTDEAMTSFGIVNA